ncbi:transporter substrate-binding domain-containing protein [Anaeromicropila populeti]|uniref:Amino acid ABC transporter substrate-binding protein, PAAT family (TC 3.A.1.3.-) n=1 Tax=Anaeromicropila populeti TaxID=37658 RepID=A0A1I6J9I9_9FIRM|nr:transporter substrate-binding domain-containing protein [Anaeromicropila populeti]SFR75170.1 amino acid ABC transporter substrate-binding protein, PAAT family (TC 3.A.1.3.-) [Anaeromicropila populeti]
MKKSIYVVLGMLMIVSLAACGKKEDNAADGGSNDSNTIIVGTEAGFAPYEYMDGDTVVGVDMDIAQAIADAMGKELVIKNMDFDGALLAVQNGKIDFVAAGVSVDEERKKYVDFSEEYVDSTEVIVVNKENPMVSSAADLKDKVIGVQQGNIADIWCSKEENVKAKEVKRYTKFVQAAEDLANGKIDCIVMDELPAVELVTANDKLVILEGEENIVFQDQYAIALKKGNTELQEQINEVIKDLKENGKIDEFIANHATQK